MPVTKNILEWYCDASSGTVLITCPLLEVSPLITTTLHTLLFPSPGPSSGIQGWSVPLVPLGRCGSGGPIAALRATWKRGLQDIF